MKVHMKWEIFEIFSVVMKHPQTISADTVKVLLCLLMITEVQEICINSSVCFPVDIYFYSLDMLHHLETWLKLATISTISGYPG